LQFVNLAKLETILRSIPDIKLDRLKEALLRKKEILATPLLCVVLTVSAFASDKATHWVGTWATSAEMGDTASAPPAPGFTDCTLRQIVHVSIGGTKIRVRFSNTYGTTGLTIPSAHVALSASGSAIQPGSDKALTFHGSPSVTIPPGAMIYSDPLEFNLAPLSDLVVTIRLIGVPEVIDHGKSGYLADVGDVDTMARYAIEHGLDEE